MSGWDDLDRLLFASVRARFENLATVPPEVVSVTKLGSTLPMSTDLLVDEGVIPDTRPARQGRVPVRVTSWSLARDLARLRVRDAVAYVRLRTGEWIAGVDLAERDDETEEW